MSGQERRMITLPSTGTCLLFWRIAVSMFPLMSQTRRVSKDAVAARGGILVHIPVSLDLLKNPVSTKCDHQFCRFCITEFLHKKSSVPCPLCKTPVTKRSLSERPKLGDIVSGIRRLMTAFHEDTGTTPNSSQSCFPLKSSLSQLSRCDGQSKRPMEQAGTATKQNDKAATTEPNSKRRKTTGITRVFIDDLTEAEPATDLVLTHINVSGGFPAKRVTGKKPVGKKKAVCRQGRQPLRRRQRTLPDPVDEENQEELCQVELVRYLEEASCGAGSESSKVISQGSDHDSVDGDLGVTGQEGMVTEEMIDTLDNEDIENTVNKGTCEYDSDDVSTDAYDIDSSGDESEQTVDDADGDYPAATTTTGRSLELKRGHVPVTGNTGRPHATGATEAAGVKPADTCSKTDHTDDLDYGFMQEKFGQKSEGGSAPNSQMQLVTGTTISQTNTHELNNNTIRNLPARTSGFRDNSSPLMDKSKACRTYTVRQRCKKVSNWIYTLPTNMGKSPASRRPDTGENSRASKSDEAGDIMATKSVPETDVEMEPVTKLPQLARKIFRSRQLGLTRGTTPPRQETTDPSAEDDPYEFKPSQRTPKAAAKNRKRPRGGRRRPKGKAKPRALSRKPALCVSEAKKTDPAVALPDAPTMETQPFEVEDNVENPLIGGQDESQMHTYCDKASDRTFQQQSSLTICVQGQSKPDGDQSKLKGDQSILEGDKSKPEGEQSKLAGNGIEPGPSMSADSSAVGDSYTMVIPPSVEIFVPPNRRALTRSVKAHPPLIPDVSLSNDGKKQHRGKQRRGRNARSNKEDDAVNLQDLNKLINKISQAETFELMFSSQDVHKQMSTDGSRTENVTHTSNVVDSRDESELSGTGCDMPSIVSDTLKPDLAAESSDTREKPAEKRTVISYELPSLECSKPPPPVKAILPSANVIAPTLSKIGKLLKSIQVKRKAPVPVPSQASSTSDRARVTDSEGGETSGDNSVSVIPPTGVPPPGHPGGLGGSSPHDLSPSGQPKVPGTCSTLMVNDTEDRPLPPTGVPSPGHPGGLGGSSPHDLSPSGQTEGPGTCSTLMVNDTEDRPLPSTYVIQKAQVTDMTEVCPPTASCDLLMNTDGGDSSSTEDLDIHPTSDEYAPPAKDGPVTPSVKTVEQTLTQCTPPRTQCSPPRGKFTPPTAQCTSPRAQCTPPTAQCTPPRVKFTPPRAQCTSPIGINVGEGGEVTTDAPSLVDLGTQPEDGLTPDPQLTRPESEQSGVTREKNDSQVKDSQRSVTGCCIPESPLLPDTGVATQSEKGAEVESPGAVDALNTSIDLCSLMEGDGGGNIDPAGSGADPGLVNSDDKHQSCRDENSEVIFDTGQSKGEQVDREADIMGIQTAEMLTSKTQGSADIPADLVHKHSQIETDAGSTAAEKTGVLKGDVVLVPESIGIGSASLSDRLDSQEGVIASSLVKNCCVHLVREPGVKLSAVNDMSKNPLSKIQAQNTECKTDRDSIKIPSSCSGSKSSSDIVPATPGASVEATHPICVTGASGKDQSNHSVIVGTTNQSTSGEDPSPRKLPNSRTSQSSVEFPVLGNLPKDEQLSLGRIRSLRRRRSPRVTPCVQGSNVQSATESPNSCLPKKAPSPKQSELVEVRTTCSSDDITGKTSNLMRNDCTNVMESECGTDNANILVDDKLESIGNKTREILKDRDEQADRNGNCEQHTCNNNNRQKEDVPQCSAMKVGSKQGSNNNRQKEDLSQHSAMEAGSEQGSNNNRQKEDLSQCSAMEAGTEETLPPSLDICDLTGNEFVPPSLPDAQPSLATLEDSASVVVCSGDAPGRGSAAPSKRTSRKRGRRTTRSDQRENESSDSEPEPILTRRIKRTRSQRSVSQASESLRSASSVSQSILEESKAKSGTKPVNFNRHCHKDTEPDQSVYSPIKTSKDPPQCQSLASGTEKSTHVTKSMTDDNPSPSKNRRAQLSDSLTLINNLAKSQILKSKMAGKVERSCSGDHGSGSPVGTPGNKTAEGSDDSKLKDITGMSDDAGQDKAVSEDLRPSLSGDVRNTSHDKSQMSDRLAETPVKRCTRSESQKLQKVRGKSDGSQSIGSSSALVSKNPARSRQKSVSKDRKEPSKSASRWRPRRGRSNKPVIVETDSESDSPFDLSEVELEDGETGDEKTEDRVGMETGHQQLTQAKISPKTQKTEDVEEVVVKRKTSTRRKPVISDDNEEVMTVKRKAQSGRKPVISDDNQEVMTLKTRAKAGRKPVISDDNQEVMTLKRRTKTGRKPVVSDDNQEVIAVKMKARKPVISDDSGEDNAGDDVCPEKEEPADNDRLDHTEDEDCSQGSKSANLTSSSAFSSQSEVLCTQQRSKLQQDVERMRQEIEALEAQLAARDSILLETTVRESDETQAGVSGGGGKTPTVTDTSTTDKRAAAVTTSEDVEKAAPDKDEKSCDSSDESMTNEIPPTDLTKGDNQENLASSQESEDLFLSPQSPSPPSSPPRSNIKPSAVSQVVLKLKEIFKAVSPGRNRNSPSKKYSSLSQGSVESTPPASPQQALPNSQRTPVTGQNRVPKGGDVAPGPSFSSPAGVQGKLGLPKPFLSPAFAGGFGARTPLRSDVASPFGRTTPSGDLKSSNRRLCFVTTGLHLSQAHKTQKLAQMFDIKVQPKFSPAATHVIVKTVSEDSLVCERTFKYFQAIAHHCWLVSYQWVEDCFTANEILPETGYEIQGDTVSGRKHRGPRRSRLYSHPVFSDFEFYCRGESPNLPPGEFQNLLTVSGATVVTSPEALGVDPDKTQLILDVNDDQQPGDLRQFNKLYRRYGVVTVSREWVFDTITQYKVQPLPSYVLTSLPNLELPFV